MANTYKGTDGIDIVHQKNDNKHDWFNIYTYGAADQVYLTLNKTFVSAGNGDDLVKSNIENTNDINLGGGNDTYIGNGFSNSNKYDQVFGNGGNDTFTVATAISDYYGDAGNDTFDSAGYWNYFNGGDGNDTISYQRQDTDSFLKGRGVKVDLFHEYAKTGGGRVEDLRNIENIIGTSYDDTLIGTNGNNKIQGMDGFDVLDGRSGKDVLDGGNGGDNLYGGGKSDKLTGGKGTDLLDGGTGSDTFIFNTLADSKVGSKRDVIDDFSHSQSDHINLSAIDDFDFIGSKAFSHTAGELQFRNEILAGDVDGDGKADFQIKVDGVSTLHNSDFIL